MELIFQRKIRRLIINVPPRTGKSTFVTICFPVWCWLRQPEHRFLCASYSLNLAEEHQAGRAKLIQSEWFQSRWGDKFSIIGNRASKLTNDRRGYYYVTSITAGTTGRGGDTILVDDPLSTEQALSETERGRATNWFDNTAQSRLNDQSTGAIVLIMQRLHELDPTGYLLQKEPGIWTHLNLPLECEGERVGKDLLDQSYEFPITKKVYVRKPGDVLLPQHYPPRVVEEWKKRPMQWAGQMQQRPAPLEGNMIKVADVRYYGGRNPITGETDEPLPEKFDMEIISADCAFKDADHSDFVAIMRIGIKGRKRYIMNIINSHLDMDATEAAIKREREGKRISAVLIEDKANGPAIIKRLQKNVSGVIAINPEGGKVARMYAAAPEWTAGDWYVDRNAAWTAPFLTQITIFPNAANDDMADAMTQASIWLQNRGGGVAEFWRQQAAEDQQKRCKAGIHRLKDGVCEFCKEQVV